jgi:membrane protease subunit HflC
MPRINFDFGNMNRRPPDDEGRIVPDGDTVEAMKLLRSSIYRWLFIIGIIVIAAFFLRQSVVITLPNQYVAIWQFGEVKRITALPGVSFKIPFIQTTTVIPKDVRHYDIPISDVITKDKKTMVADSFVLWRVTEPLTFIRKASGSVAQAESFILNNSYNSLKNVISGLLQTDIISGRDTLAQLIFDNLGNALDAYGLEMVAIETKHLDLPDDNKNAVYDRMISERNNIAAQYTAEGDEEARMIRNETDKTVNISISEANAEAAKIIADGESRYMEILAQAYNDPERAEFYSFARALDAAKVALKGGGDTLILSKDSPIARIFYNE